MSILKKTATVKEPVAEGNYELPLVEVKEVENTAGGYVQLTFRNETTEIIHNIFGSNERQIEYTIQTLARQLNIAGDNVTLEDVLVKGFMYKLYVSYNQFGRNVSFGVRKEMPESVEEVL